MGKNLIGAAVVALAGFGIAFLNYIISKHVLIKSPQKYSFTTVLRQALQVIFLAAVYFIGQKTDFELLYLLLGAATGVTLPMFYFTKKLVSVNEAQNKNKTVKEDEADG